MAETTLAQRQAADTDFNDLVLSYSGYGADELQAFFSGELEKLREVSIRERLFIDGHDLFLTSEVREARTLGQERYDTLQRINALGWCLGRPRTGAANAAAAEQYAPEGEILGFFVTHYALMADLALELNREARLDDFWDELDTEGELILNFQAESVGYYEELQRSASFRQDSLTRILALDMLMAQRAEEEEGN